MRNSIRAPSPISRIWDTYLVKAVFDNKDPANKGLVQSEGAGIHSDFEAQIFVLPNPVVINANEVKDIITVNHTGKLIRFYPPFPLNERAETTGVLTDIAIPEGISTVVKSRSVPKHAVTGVRMQHNVGPSAIWCRGIRADVQAGAHVQNALTLLIEHICQYTSQWWLRATHSPFIGMMRLGCATTSEFSLVDTLSAGEKEGESPWYGAVQFQPNLGIAAVLTNEVWKKVAEHVSSDQSPETGILGFLDAVADYMAGRDDKCILNLCIAVEVLLNKHHRLVLKKTTNESLDKVLRKSPLVDEATKDELKKLLIDRNHVAHGRSPYIVGPGSRYTIERYIFAVRRVLSAYLNSIPGQMWPEVMSMKLDPVRR